MSRHITGVDTIYWGSDYPHAEGTFLGSQAVIKEQFAGVPDEDRAEILGGNLAKIVGFDDSKKLAPVNPPARPRSPLRPEPGPVGGTAPHGSAGGCGGHE